MDTAGQEMKTSRNMLLEFFHENKLEVSCQILEAKNLIKDTRLYGLQGACLAKIVSLIKLRKH